jgi:two-component system alkaline phosphatase synthesis response regulator PhoP
MIWFVEDDGSIRDIALYALNAAGFETKGFEDGLSCWEELKKEKPDLIVLDIMLPGMDGLELLTKIKESIEYNSIPVILATAKGQEYDRIHGLDLGADDYIVKPFSIMEMVSRVKAVLRRSQPQQASKLLKAGGLVVNLDEYTVYVDGKRIQLTYKEF